MEVRCTQCGAQLKLAPDTHLFACAFCGSAQVLDASGALLNHVMLPTVSTTQVHTHVRRFLAGRQTVAGLDREAVLGAPRLEYFPFWAFTIKDGGEEVVLEPAAPSALQGLSGLRLPAARTEPMSPDLLAGSPAREPEVPLETARQWLSRRRPKAQTLKTVLYHLPLYRLEYSWKGRSYTIAVEGVSGKVLPADFPAKAEAPFVLVAVLALLVFGIEGLIVSNLVLKLGLYLVSAPPLLAVAWLVSRKV